MVFIIYYIHAIGNKLIGELLERKSLMGIFGECGDSVVIRV
ncbi:hypothetical protein J5U23_01747 [Saccharolobus shibatae B12]|uniref:Uncharacterized protein n=2 Tax=Saccharolobus shibatae TaxID=2286 RepID=A0A8F5BP45_SACSH|nr:hypothetical protein J5U23_01747 [Saccharolobus shibatae B12]QXJ32165.1 hypothetical protein J5U21_01816 [Saccharolobus shibatae]